MFPMSLAGDNEFDEPEIVLIETTGTNQAPNWLDEDDGIVSLEAQFLDLQYLCLSMNQAQGMNKQIAMEANRVLPGFEEKYPLGYFTEETTATNYKVALEELHVGVWALIGAAAAAAAMLIWKLTRWIIKLFKGGSDDDSSSGGSGKPSDKEITDSITEAANLSDKKARENPTVVAEMEKAVKGNQEGLEALRHALPEIRQAVTGSPIDDKEPNEVQHGAKTEPAGTSHPRKDFSISDFTSIEAYQKAIYNRDMVHKYAPLVKQERHSFYDIASQGEWTKTMVSFGPVISSLEVMLQQRVLAIESLFGARLINGDKQALENSKSMLTELAKSLPTPGTPYADLKAFADACRNVKSLQATNTKGEELDMNTIGERLKMFFGDQKYRSVLTARTDALKRLSTMHDAEMKMADVALKWNGAHPGQGQGMGVPMEISSMVAKAATQIQQDFRDFSYVIVTVQHFLRECDEFNLQCNTYWAQFWSINKREISRAKLPVELPDSVSYAAQTMYSLRENMGYPSPLHHRVNT